MCLWGGVGRNQLGRPIGMQHYNAYPVETCGDASTATPGFGWWIFHSNDDGASSGNILGIETLQELNIKTTIHEGGIPH